MRSVADSWPAVFSVVDLVLAGFFVDGGAIQATDAQKTAA
jgi:hypothetical protein